MILTQADAKKITDKVLSLSKADSCTVSLSGRARGHLRFALNCATTSGFQDGLSLSIESSFGKRRGSATINEFGDPAILAAVRQSEEIARLVPENAEFLPPLGPQSYLESRAFFYSTAGTRTDQLAGLCGPVLHNAHERKVTAAGFLQVGADCSAMATSNSLFAHEKSTNAHFTVSARSGDGTGAGWAGTEAHDIDRLDAARLGRVAVDKTLESRNPTAIEPGKYTVILEPSAVCDLLGMMLGHFDARSADEGRSFLTRKGGGNRLGEKVFGDQVNLFSDPQSEIAPGGIYSTDGLPAKKRAWVEGGVVKDLIYSRYWGQKMNREPVPYPTNLIMEGGNASMEDMVRSTRRGIIVTRFWYIRTVDPRTLVFTGLTRDGTFLIENGRITRSVKNFRFNESPVAMLNHIDAMGPSERTIGSEVEHWPVAVPRLLVKEFTFSSLSDAI